jgi:integrase
MATLGHANISVTLNIYGHVLRETQEEAATQMGDLLTGLTA